MVQIKPGLGQRCQVSALLRAAEGAGFLTTACVRNATSCGVRVAKCVVGTAGLLKVGPRNAYGADISGRSKASIG